MSRAAADGDSSREGPPGMILHQRLKSRRLVLRAPLTHEEDFSVRVPSGCVTSTHLSSHRQDGSKGHSFTVYVIDLAFGEAKLRVAHRFSALYKLAVRMERMLDEEPPLVDLPFVPLPRVPGPLRRQAPSFPGRTIPFFEDKNNPVRVRKRAAEITTWLTDLLSLHEFLQNDELVRILTTSSAPVETQPDEEQLSYFLSAIAAASAEILKLRVLEGVEHNAVCTRRAKELGLLHDCLPTTGSFRRDLDSLLDTPNSMTPLSGTPQPRTPEG